jgi:Tol biopolymer transport system component
MAAAAGSYPFFSFDGQWLAYFTSGGLRRMPVGGGSSSLIVPMGFGTGAAGRVLGGTWGPNDTIVFATSLGLFRAPADGGERATLLIEPPDGEAYGWPHTLPDGRGVLFSRLAGGSADRSEIAVLDLESLAVRTIQQGGVGAQLVAGEILVYATGERLEAIRFNPRTGRTSGVPVAMPGVEVLSRGAYLVPGFAVSHSGTLVRLPPERGERDQALVWVDATGTTEPVPGLAPGTLSYARFSPDGMRLAVNVHQVDLTDRRIWTLDLERGVAVQVSGRSVAAGSFEDLLPQWHPSGERIYFSSNRSGAFQIYAVAADGSGSEVRVIDDPDVQMPYRIDRANRLLFFRGPFAEADAGLLDLSAPDAGPRWVLAQPWSEVNATLSDDARWIAYESDESGNQYEVYVRPYPGVQGGRVQVSTGGGRQPLWSPFEPDVLYYRHPNGAMMSARLETTTGLQVGAVTELFAGDGSKWAVRCGRSNPAIS